MKDDEIHAVRSYYSDGAEERRLEQPEFLLEALRTRRLITKELGGKGLDILDVGGGAGYYSYWLADLGHRVRLLDLSLENITRAHERGHDARTKLVDIRVGDARELPYGDGLFDIVLLMGPLYHLQRREDRRQCLKEAWRVLRTGGKLLSVVLSRAASLIDGLKHGRFCDKRFADIVEHDLATGFHENATGERQYFTKAYLHAHEEIGDEQTEAGFKVDRIEGIEGLGVLCPLLKNEDQNSMEMARILTFIEATAAEPWQIGVSPHVMCVATKPSDHNWR